MIKIEAIIQPGRFEQVKEALIELGVEGMTVSEVRGHGRQKGHTESYRGREYETDLMPKVKLELVLDDKIVDSVVDMRPPAKLEMERFFFTKQRRLSASATRSVV